LFLSVYTQNLYKIKLHSLVVGAPIDFLNDMVAEMVVDDVEVNAEVGVVADEENVAGVGTVAGMMEDVIQPEKFAESGKHQAQHFL